MLFNSIMYALFLPTIFILYWFMGSKVKFQNFFLLAASYYFYGSWDYRFLFLLMFSTFLDYYTGIKIHETKSVSRKKIWFWTSILTNLGFLGVFKYYNFFTVSFAKVAERFGVTLDPWMINVILPVGISFYTFHGLSYVIDIYKNRIQPEKDLVAYSLFVSFFPLLVAGPIERATHLLPQIKQPRVFTYSKGVDALKQILWGLFKKVVVADSCAVIVNKIFEPTATHSGSTLLFGAVLFTFQIYGDFSGYSDIARGSARLFGFELLKNFSYPYFSRDIAEFWRRWHISLSSWFRDYLYVPLGGSQGGVLNKIRNTFIIFIISGFWHGANLTFIAWGTLNAIYFLPLLLTNKNRNNMNIIAEGRYLPTMREFIGVLITFSMTVFAWILFRASGIRHAFRYIKGIFNRSLFTFPDFWSHDIAILICSLLILEWIGREDEHALVNFANRWPRFFRWNFYYGIIILLMVYSGSQQQFIYFQF